MTTLAEAWKTLTDELTAYATTDHQRARGHASWMAEELRRWVPPGTVDDASDRSWRTLPSRFEAAPDAVERNRRGAAEARAALAAARTDRTPGGAT